MVDQFLVERHAILGAVRVAVECGQRQFRHRNQFFVASRSYRLKVVFSAGVVAHTRRGHAQEITRHIRRAGVRIFVHDRLKLFPGSLRALLGRSKTGDIGLCRDSRRPKLRLQSPGRLRQIEAGFLVLCALVIPSARCNASDYYNGDNGDGQSIPVFYAPVGGLLGSSDGDPAERILFKLMAGLCAHDYLSVSVCESMSTTLSWWDGVLVYQPEKGTG